MMRICDIDFKIKYLSNDLQHHKNVCKSNPPAAKWWRSQMAWLRIYREIQALKIKRLKLRQELGRRILNDIAYACRIPAHMIGKSVSITI